MFLLNVFLALLATSGAQSGIPQYIQGQWVFGDDILQYDDTDEQYMAAEESTWLDSPPETVELKMVENQNSLTTLEPFVMKEEGLEGESEVWKIALVVVVLLVSLVGSLSMAYYLCVWRGGRIHYQHQKEGYA
ncbi:hypothetical protein Q8A73_019710 [Channa argus]|nr:hypothetical protein Q8A73_019710 [Channa argus]